MAKERTSAFLWRHNSVREVLNDRGLSSLGDSYINFVFSLALSNRKGQPEGTKVKGSFLAEALRRAGLRQYLSSSLSRHALADAAEALFVYAWLSGSLSIDDCVSTLAKSDDPIEGLTRLLVTTKNKLTFP